MGKCIPHYNVKKYNSYITQQIGGELLRVNFY